MNFTLSPALLELQAATRRFIADVVIPLENDPRQSSHGPDETLRTELVGRARDAGLLTPHASIAMGGMGLNHVAKSLVFEEAGYVWHFDLKTGKARQVPIAIKEDFAGSRTELVNVSKFVTAVHPSPDGKRVVIQQRALTKVTFAGYYGTVVGPRCMGCPPCP